MTISKRCKIHYRHLERDNNKFPSMTLGKAIASALKQQADDGTPIGAKAEHRLTGVPRQDDFKRLLNNYDIRDDVVFGDLCLFSPGTMQALLQLSQGEYKSLDEIMKSYGIAEKKAPDGTEYLQGLCYWAVIGDHLYQIQHVSLQAKALEEYFTWLLRDKANIVSSSQYVSLRMEFDRAQVGDLTDVAGIEVGGLVPETVRDIDPQTSQSTRETVVDVEERESVGSKLVRGWSAAKTIISDLLGPIEAQKIIDSVPPEASLEVTVNIGYRSTKRKVRKEFMNNLASGLRNMADGEVRVRGKDGEIKGDDARLSMDMMIKRVSPSSSLLDLESVYSQMLEVHRRFLHDGKITQ